MRSATPGGSERLNVIGKPLLVIVKDGPHPWTQVEFLADLIKPRRTRWRVVAVIDDCYGSRLSVRANEVTVANSASWQAAITDAVQGALPAVFKDVPHVPPHISVVGAWQPFVEEFFNFPGHVALSI
jgi:hypothetical protein